MLLNINDTVSEIAKEAARLEPLEQQILLTKLRVKRLRKKSSVVVSNSTKIKKSKPTLRQIDKWKHESRLNEK